MNKLELDEFARGELPERVLEHINSIELTLEEVSEWEQSKSPIRILVSSRKILVDIRLRIPMTVVLVIVIIAVVTGSGLGGVIISFVTKLFS